MRGDKTERVRTSVYVCAVCLRATESSVCFQAPPLTLTAKTKVCYAMHVSSANDSLFLLMPTTDFH